MAVAVFGAPPRNTWSGSRELDIATGPVPLRDGFRPWGVEGLKATELGMLELTTALLTFMLHILVDALAAGIAGMLEHPAFPEVAPA